LIILPPARYTIGKGREDGERQRIGMVRVIFRGPDDAAYLFQVALGSGIEGRIDQPHQIARWRSRAGTERCGRPATFFTYAALDGVDHQSREPRMQRITRHPTRAICVHAQAFQQILGPSQSGRWGRV